MSKILYTSTNGSVQSVGFWRALLEGLAPDRGLYMPDMIPILSNSELVGLKNMTYGEMASSILWKFLDGEIEKAKLDLFCEEAYNFELPIEPISDGLNVLRLDQGPTASFKDFAARLMARLFNYSLEKEDRELTILTATSGDTGSAVASAFYGMDRIKVIVLYPHDEVSELQRKQMTTIGGNIRVLAVKGKFDDCQALVKEAFSDPELTGLDLSSANSINIGRLLPQTVYYFYAWSRLCKLKQKLIISVPSGNFGNLVGGLIAYRMGLPVEKFIVSVNENDEFPRFLNSGKYLKVEPSRNCISSAMNVGHPSNLARLVNMYNGDMDENGIIKELPDMDAIEEDIDSFSFSDIQTKAIIKDIWKKFATILEPHGAVAMGGFLAWQKSKSSESDARALILETAHPAKFSSLVKECTGVIPPFPDSLRGLIQKKESELIIESDYKIFKNYLINGD